MDHNLSFSKDSLQIPPGFDLSISAGDFCAKSGYTELFELDREATLGDEGQESYGSTPLPASTNMARINQLAQEQKLGGRKQDGSITAIGRNLTGATI